MLPVFFMYLLYVDGVPIRMLVYFLQIEKPPSTFVFKSYYICSYCVFHLFRSMNCWN